MKRALAVISPWGEARCSPCIPKSLRAAATTAAARFPIPGADSTLGANKQQGYAMKHLLPASKNRDTRIEKLRLAIFSRSSILTSLFLWVAIVLPWGLASSVAAQEFSARDQVVVGQQGAPLKRGSRTLATLDQGQRLNVVETRGNWVGTRVTVDGQLVAGWLHKRYLSAAGQLAQGRTTRRVYSYQPAPAVANSPSTGRGYSPPQSNNGLIIGLTPYNRSYWRADRKISGY